eukprot:jgi/Mesvir1/12189/Mv00426-RA.1
MYSSGIPRIVQVLWTLLLLTPFVQSLANSRESKCRAEDEIAYFGTIASKRRISLQQRHNELQEVLGSIIKCLRDHKDKARCPLAGLFDDSQGDPGIVLVGNGASVLKGNMGRRIDKFPYIMRFNNLHVRGFEHHVGSRTSILFLGSLREIIKCTDEQKASGLESIACVTDDAARGLWSQVEETERSGTHGLVSVLSASTQIPAFLLLSQHAPQEVRSMSRVWRLSNWPSGKMANEVLDTLSKNNPRARLSTRFKPDVVLRNGMYAIIMLLQCGIKPTLAGFDVGLAQGDAYTHHYYPRPEEPVQELSGRAARKAMRSHEKSYHDFYAEGQVLKELLTAGLISQLT